MRRRQRALLFGAIVLFVILVLINDDKKVIVNNQTETKAIIVDAHDDNKDTEAMRESSPRRPTRQISILGERNSGTRWIYDHLQTCFNHSLWVKRDLTRYKHWFQYDNATKYHHSTLVVAMFRNPYSWLAAMRRKPHGAPNHLRLNNYTEFLTRTWTMNRIGSDLTVSKDVKEGNVLCQQDFKYNEIVSCEVEPVPAEQYNHTLAFSEQRPFYEMKPGGEPFANIMELRSAKIRNFLSVHKYKGISNVWPTQYEYLLFKGTKALLNDISELTGVPYKCEPFPPQQDRIVRRVTSDLVRIVNANLDWSAEKLIGYSQMAEQNVKI